MKEIVCENDIMQSITEEMKKKNLYLNKRNLNILKEVANRLFNRLTKELKYNANVTIIARTQECADLYGEILGDVIEELSKTKDKGRKIDGNKFFASSEWKEQCQTILLVKDYKGDKPEELFQILVDIERNGWLPVVILCMTEENVEKLKEYKEQDNRLYHYLCGAKIFVSEVNDNDIYDCILEKLENAGFTWTDAFSTRLANCIDTVYPKTCTKKEIFVDDLLERIYQVYSGRISVENKLDVGDVPYLKKVEIALEKHNGKKRAERSLDTSINEVAQETHFTDLENRKNVLILSMSTLPKKKNLSQYYVIEKDDDGNKSYQTFSGFSQLEPGTKYFLSKLARKNIKPDKIIILTTKETWETEEAYKEDEKEKSAVDVYSENIVHFLQSNGDHGVEEQLKDALEQCVGMKKMDLPTDFSKLYSLGEGCERIQRQYCNKYQSEYLDELNQYFAEDTTGTVKPILLDENSLFEISKELNSLLHSADPQKYGVNLFIDLQGGTRTYMFTLFAALTLWRNKNVKIKDMFAIKFDPSKKYHPIESVSREYAMIDLVSGIRAFTRYGKVGELQQFIESRGNVERPVKKLLEIMKDIDGYMQINDPENFQDKLKELVKVEGENKQAENEVIKEIPEGCLLDKENYKDNQFKLIVDDLKETYAPIILNQPSDLDIIKWFGEKEFTTSALTFIEDKIPEIMMEKGNGIICAKYDENLTSKELSQKYGSPSFYKPNHIIFNSIFNGIMGDLENEFYKRVCGNWSEKLIKRLEDSKQECEISLLALDGLIQEDSLEKEVWLNLEKKLGDDVWSDVSLFTICKLAYGQNAKWSTFKDKNSIGKNMYQNTTIAKAKWGRKEALDFFKEKESRNNARIKIVLDYMAKNSYTYDLNDKNDKKLLIKMLGDALFTIIFKKDNLKGNANKKKYSVAIKNVCEPFFESLGVEIKSFEKVGIEDTNQNNIKIEFTNGKDNIAKDKFTYDIWKELLCLIDSYEENTIEKKVKAFLVNDSVKEKLEVELQKLIVQDADQELDTLMNYAQLYAHCRQVIDCIKNNTCKECYDSSCSWKNIKLYTQLHSDYKDLWKKQFYMITDKDTEKVMETIAGIHDGFYGEQDWIEISIGQESIEKRELLNTCILLYKALKSERNSTNHAEAVGSNHMNYRYTQKAIKVFGELCEKLLDKSKEDMKNNNNMNEG